MNMKKSIALAVVIVTLFLFSCSSGNENENQTIKTIDFNSFKIIKKDFSNLREMGKIVKVVKLETIDSSVIGSIDKVIVDPKTGDFLIGDFGPLEKVLRFSPQGKFIRSYGQSGEGPKEHKDLRDFAVSSNGDIVLLTVFKLIKFSPTGEFLKEVRINYLGGNIEIVNDKIYISVLRYRNRKEGKHAVLIYDSSLVRTGGLKAYDSRLYRYIYTFSPSMAKNKDRLYFLDNYEFNLNIYETKTRELTVMTVPNKNSELESIWSKKRLTRDDEDRISEKVHRFSGIFSLDNRLLLYESYWGKKFWNAWLMDLEKKEVIIFKRDYLYGDYRVKVQKDLYFNRIPGSWKNGIIGIFDDESRFNRHKHKFPLLKDIELNLDDNPILVLYEFNRWW